MHARAAVLVEPGRYEVREFKIPEPEPGAVLVKNELSGICGTDKHTYQGFTSQYGGASLASSTPFPIIQGHENVGTVTALNGPTYDFDGDRLEEGDRVIVSPNLTCKRCYACMHGYPVAMCSNLRDYGNTISASEPPHLFGGWAEYMYAFPGSFIIRVPDDLPSNVAVLTEVFAVTASLDRAKRNSELPSDASLFDDTVVIYGVGPLGLCHVIKARMLGAGTIIAVDLSDRRLEYASRIGADHTINASRVDVDQKLEFVRDLTHGRGADVVVECAGVPDVIPTCIDLLRPGGVLLEAGNFSDLGTVSISPHKHLCSKGISLFGVPGQEPAAYAPSMRQMARYRKSYPVDELVSERFSLTRTKEAVEWAVDPGSLKVVIDPWAAE
jgi:L-iditol 2-dehydrogenase